MSRDDGEKEGCRNTYGILTHGGMIHIYYIGLVARLGGLAPARPNISMQNSNSHFDMIGRTSVVISLYIVRG